MMLKCLWNGNVEHVEEHELTVEDVEHVLANPVRNGVSRSPGFPCVFGYTPEGIFINVIYEQIDSETVYPITAYEIEED